MFIILRENLDFDIIKPPTSYLKKPPTLLQKEGQVRPWLGR